MESIGGYLGLEKGEADSSVDGIAVDLGRHALELILRARRCSELLVPRYTCDALAPALERTGVSVGYYDLDAQLDPVLPANDAPVLYTNYFGLKQATVERLAADRPHLIVDNVHAFYAPIPSVADGFVSCRKFFGVADGAYAFCSAAEGTELPPATSHGRYTHLITAAEQGTEAGFPLYQEHERRLADAPLAAMSRLTAALMQGVDHARVRATRTANRDRLHAALRDRNRLPIDPAAAEVPMVYPFLPDDQQLRARLQAARIYVARYWPGLLAPLAPHDGAHPFEHDVLYLPVDQRYGAAHMDRILDVVVG